MKAAFLAKGRVQGVGYRRFALEEARILGLAGWVRNEPGGSVRGEAGGTEAMLAAYRAVLAEGPAFASVETLDWRALDEGQSLPFPFEIRP